ncbi:prolyl oligopeptidase family serine peptidase [Microbacterium sp. 22195]|uniref:prolyl oligopeptidase family serine peptidase n=1 Tax=Microbacterium sp. 22195 TaxID=3453891 RepID=UPI003F832393
MIPYPPARLDDVVEHVAGIPIPDPYRWLEGETEEVRAWQRAQAELAAEVIGATGKTDAARALIAEHERGARPGLPRHGGGRWFRVEVDSVLVASEPYGAGRTLVTLSTFDEPGRPAVLAWFAPSPDGRVLALGVCTDGSEHNSIRLIDVDTGRIRDDAPGEILHSAWGGGVSWLPDGSGFLFLALAGSAADFRQVVYRRMLGEHGSSVVEDIPVPAGSREYTRIQFSRDGRWAVASHRVGTPIPVAVRDLTSGAPWRRFIHDCPDMIAGHIVGDSYVAVTDHGSPRGRVVAIALDEPHPDDPSTWRVLVPESDTVLRSLTPVGGHLYLSGFAETAARIRVLSTARVDDRDPGDRGAGIRCADAGEVPLPADGALGASFFPLTGLNPDDGSGEFLFAFSTLTTSWSVHRHRPGDDHVDELIAPAVRVAASVEYRSATSADGTAVPYHVVRPDGLPAGPAPALISAYGAAGIPTLPGYQPDLAAFVAAGGTLVQAHLRGGGEFGRDWFRAADRERRRVRDADLLAVARDLIAQGISEPRMLALTGGSDGGLMCGVAVTEHPQLWCAVLPRAPLLDLIGGIRIPYLEFVIRKAWGDPGVPADIERLRRSSPYELVSPAAFPLVYVQAGDTDPRCPPAQARKFVARMQAAQRGEQPILLHVFENAGHGAGTSAAVLQAQDAEWLAVLMAALGLSGRV